MGSAIVRALMARGYDKLIVQHQQGWICATTRVCTFFTGGQTRYVFPRRCQGQRRCNNSTLPAEFIYDNLAIQTNASSIQAYLHGVKKLLLLGSSCLSP